MNIKVYHALHYTYEQEVFLQPHILYIHPKAYPHQHIKSYNLSILPTPSMIANNIDAEGNHQQIVYFNEPTRQLDVVVEMVVQSENFNVYDFVLFPFETERIPFQYPIIQLKYLQPYLDKYDVTPYIEQYAHQILNNVGGGTVPFLSALCYDIYSNFVYERRDEGAAFSPEVTLQQQKGSCRDFARLFIACCKAIGIAARFVSGYLYGNPLQAHELHAWVEAYLPGAGWRGFDPTEGKAVINNHIYLASSADSNSIAPVVGTYLGVAHSQLETDIQITEI